MSGPQSHYGGTQYRYEQPLSERRPYSYLHTPVEVQAPVFSSRPSGSLTSDQKSNIHEPCLPSNTERSRPLSYTPSISDRTAEKEPAAIPSTHSRSQSNPTPPPLSQHPAQFAPYAENTTPPNEYKSQPVYVPNYPPIVTNAAATSPLSPGPLPLKHNSQEVSDDQQRREGQLGIVPDNNPLTPQSRGSTFNSNPKSTSRMTQMSMSPGTSDKMYHVPGQAIHPRQELKGGTWKHGMCDCSDISTCCTGLLCPCILYGRTQYRLSMKSDRKDPTNLLGYETCNASCTVMALLCGCQWLFATIQHYRTRRAYDIPGGAMSDCVRSSCCTCCTLIQDEREIKSREESASTNTVNTPYSTPGDMSFSPPPR